MDAESLKTVGQVAGLAGVVVSLVFALFKEIIRKKIFPNLTKEQAYRIIRLIIISAAIVAVTGIIAWAAVKIPKNVSKTTSSEQQTQEEEDPVSVKLISARPGNTDVGSAEFSIREINNILNNSIRDKLSELCFENEIDKDLYGRVSFLIYQTSDGYANNFSLNETNIDESYKSCIRDVFRGTKFPEPTDPPDTLINDQGERYADHLGVSYWITAKLNVRK